MPKPSLMNFSSASGSCTSTMSASPRRAVSSAWPVPWAITRTSMPVACANAGRIRSSSPESWTEVVEASTIAGAATACNGISTAITRIAARAAEIDQARMENFVHVIGLSLGVSLCAAALATVVGLSLGAALAVYDFPGRQVLVLLSNAFFGLPPVTVGVALYLLLSRTGPLGLFSLLFTPGAMILAQATLATPIVTALVHRAVSDAWREYGGALMVDGATRLRSIPHLL